MAMGDLCAVEFAQSAHLAVLLQCGGFAPHELLRLRSAMPRGPFTAGVVVDDLVLLERVVSGLGKGTFSSTTHAPNKGRLQSSWVAGQ